MIAKYYDLTNGKLLTVSELMPRLSGYDGEGIIHIDMFRKIDHYDDSILRVVECKKTCFRDKNNVDVFNGDIIQDDNGSLYEAVNLDGDSYFRDMEGKTERVTITIPYKILKNKYAVV